MVIVCALAPKSICLTLSSLIVAWHYWRVKNFFVCCYSSVNLSPVDFPVKMSPYEKEGDIERKGTETIIGFE